MTLKFNKKNISLISLSIASIVSDWMNQYSKFSPNEIKKRIKSYSNLKNIIRVILGFFYKYKFGEVRELYIFEGVRYKEYMSALNPNSIIIIGSHVEKKFAIENNYGFIWSFPITSAVEIMITMGWKFFLDHQISNWISDLNKFNKINFILYEDTQPVGVYLNKISEILEPNTKCICIQHGFFVKNLGMRYDGSITKFNFVWDDTQINLISASKENTYIIGLPYYAIAKKNDHISVVFVGLGTAGDGSDCYEKSLKIYSNIKKNLSKLNINDVIYRPHPNEWADKILISKLKKMFGDLDQTDKVVRLNSSHSIFVGTVSSLLYEAGIAGHTVASLVLNTELITLFRKNIEFKEFEVNYFIEWVVSNKEKLISKSCFEEIDPFDPKDRFQRLISDLE